MLVLRLSVAAALLAAAPGARADEAKCGPKNAVLGQLKERYGEVPVLAFKMPTGEMIIVTSGASTHTVLMVDSVMACIVADGRNA